MKIIDAHLHFSRIKSFVETARAVSKVNYSSRGLLNEFSGSGVVAGIGMGLKEIETGGFPDNSSPNPMMLDLEEELPDFIFTCIGINPVRLESPDQRSELLEIEKAISQARVVGIKIYAGYYHYNIFDPVYFPVYELAEKYGLPVVIHCGATYSQKGLLKYSHPLNVDELAVRFRNVTFVISHLGDPWVMDTAAVIYKNSNVFADLSGLIVADSSGVDSVISDRVFMDHIRRGLVFESAYDRFLFGSDWPLVPIGPYIKFISYLIPEEYHSRVFFENALKVFKKLGHFLGSK